MLDKSILFRSKREPTHPLSDCERATLTNGRRVFYVTLIFAIGVPCMLLMLACLLYPLEAIDPFIRSLHAGLNLWRLALFLIVIGGWRYGASWYAQCARLNECQISILMAYRWRMALWLLVMEALFVQEVLADFVLSIITLEG